MDAQEYSNWKEITELSKTGWVCDLVTWHNQKSLLYYKGGEDGAFIRLEADGTASIGKYEGALPHIGEALFRPIYSCKVADTATAALDYITPKLKVSFDPAQAIWL